jgi:TRAP-type transport system small permease protein
LSRESNNRGLTPWVGRWVERVLGLTACVVIFAMMTLTFIDVSGRKLFTKPVYGAYEMTEFMLGTLIFCALPLVTARSGHVTIDVFDYLVPRAAKRFQKIVVSLISAAALGFITWRLWILAAEHAKNNEVSMTLYIPHGPFARFFAIMTALATIAALVNAWLAWRRRETTAGTGFDTAA